MQQSEQATEGRVQAALSATAAPPACTGTMALSCVGQCVDICVKILKCV